MITANNYPALLAALLALGACAKADDDATETGSAGQTTTAGTTAGEPSSGGGTTQGETDATAGEATTQSSTPTTGEPTTGEPTTAGDLTTGEATTGGDALSCATYCASIAANCSGGHTQYGAPDTCLATCAAFVPGDLADTAGNTLGCRIYHAGAAKDAPEVHCTHAGRGGDGVCGANCDGFCTIAALACPDAWPDEAACQTACATFSPDESYDATDVAGDTLACRLYHLTAATVDPATHCGHIKGDSPPCK